MRDICFIEKLENLEHLKRGKIIKTIYNPTTQLFFSLCEYTFTFTSLGIYCIRFIAFLNLRVHFEICFHDISVMIPLSPDMNSAAVNVLRYLEVGAYP